MRFDNFVDIVPGPSVAIERRDEVAQLARERLAQSVQMRLRGRIDFGVDKRSAQKAQAIRVAAEGGRLVIREEDQGAVLGAATASVQSRQDAKTIDDLFEPSSGIPEFDGDRLMFRTVRAEDMFGSQRQRQVDETVEHTVTDTLRTGIVDAYEDAFNEIARRHPEEQ